MKVQNRLSGGSERVKIVALMHLVNGMAVRRDHAQTRSLSQAVPDKSTFRASPELQLVSWLGGLHEDIFDHFIP